MKFVRIFLVSTFVSHAIASAVGGSLWPSDWSRLLLVATVFLIAPLIALGAAVLEGAFE